MVLVLGVCLGLSASLTAFAADADKDVIVAEGVTEVFSIEEATDTDVPQENIHQLVIENAFTRGANKPSTSSVWNTADNGKYTFEFSAYGTSKCYSNYNFTGTTTAKLFINAGTSNNNTSDYGVRVYKSASGIDSKIADFNRNTGTDTETWISMTNLDEDALYYFVIIPGGVYIDGDGYWKE